MDPCRSNLNSAVRLDVCNPLSPGPVREILDPIRNRARCNPQMVLPYILLHTHTSRPSRRRLNWMEQLPRHLNLLERLLQRESIFCAAGSAGAFCPTALALGVCGMSILPTPPPRRSATVGPGATSKDLMNTYLRDPMFLWGYTLSRTRKARRRWFSKRASRLAVIAGRKAESGAGCVKETDPMEKLGAT